MNDYENLSGDFPVGGENYDVEFDQLLRQAMHSRPEPIAPQDLARQAMTIARKTAAAQAHKHAIRLARQRRWMQFTAIAATLLIVAMLAGAAHRMWARGDIASIANAAASDSSSNSSSSSDSDSTTTQTTSTSSSTANTIAIVFVVELLAMGMVLMSMSRGGQIFSWEPEGAAGF